MNNKLKKDSMIYPPINELVGRVGKMIGEESKGNRYSLVMTAAKRARDISRNERTNEKDNQLSQSNDLRVGQRPDKARKNQSDIKKPIAAALEEIYNDEVYLTQGDEGYKTDNYNETIGIYPTENDMINYANDDEDINSIMGEAPAGVIVDNDVPEARDIGEILNPEN